MRAIVLERNKQVNRRLARYFLAAGMEVIVVEDPRDLLRHTTATEGTVADVIVADTFDGDVVAQAVRASPGVRGLLYTAEPLRRSMRYLVENPAISNVLGRKDFDSTPRPWELAMVLRRLLEPRAAPPSLSAYLDWGYTSFQERVPSSQARDTVVARVQSFVLQLQVPKRVSEMFGELAHELLMNAMYDAPVDAAGNAKYALDRKAELTLAEAEQPILRAATDGSRLVLQVRDPFGRLQRKHVFEGLARGLAQGEMDTSHGGAGLGMMVCHNSSAAMFFDVTRGIQTEVTGMFELDLNLREFRTQAKSLHFFQAEEH